MSHVSVIELENSQSLLEETLMGSGYQKRNVFFKQSKLVLDELDQ